MLVFVISTKNANLNKFTVFTCLPDWKIQYEYYYEGTVAQWKQLSPSTWLWIELDENDNVISEPVVHCKDGDYKVSENW